VGFVQFSGTDALMRRAGVPALADALDECVRTVQQATEAHDVTFFESDINRDGGKIMLTAGAPRSAGDDEDRMLRAARRIVERAGVLPVRIGVNRGHVFAGDFGPEFRRTYSVKGDAVNLAARVMARAQPGEVLATEAILAASRTAFELERLEPFFVKGKAKAVDAARVGPMRGESATADDGGAFVGRDDELALVARALESLPAGTGTLIDIVGEPGIGKSRLVAEIRARAGGLAVVSGRGGTYESTTAYFPFRRLLREALAHHFAVDEVGDPVPYLHRLAGEVPELAPWLPLLAIPFDVSLPDTTETRELDEQFRKPRLEEVTLEALRRLLPGPTVFVLEDAHLVDDASVDLLRRVESERAERPWAVLVTRRDAPSGYRPTGSEPDDVHLPLQALDADAALRLVAAETRGAPLTREVMKVIAQRAGGNPLFLAGLAKVTGRSGRLADLPESIEGLVTSQIDRLDPRDRTVLRYAAVLGMRFEEAALSEILAGRVDGGDAVAAGRLADFLERHGEGGLRFRHSLIRDVAYAGLPFRLRREAHERVGRALESRSAEPAAESELLSLHFFHAGVYDKAWTYSRIAGRRAHSRRGRATRRRPMRSPRCSSNSATCRRSPAHRARPWRPTGGRAASSVRRRWRRPI
jgi:class 3 adenylate cyclase